ncbi:MAG: zinc ribbon domain-containing protein [Acidobacteria bacterium]|nr:zinc ribbon domain-containing protein [Acidobacteriota bacterium]MBI3422960.1 zinc ribbon domain-containing protein [Acidobacteriota bacterium]
MYCPNCSTKAVPGQRYCRSCGANLGAIVDAMEGKGGQIDFETLKADLKELGKNLSVGYKQVKENLKAQTNKLNQPNQSGQQNWWVAGQAQPPVSLATAATPATPTAPAATLPPQVVREMRKTLKDLRRMYNKVKLANTRKHSLQQGMLSIFGGGALMFAWHEILQRALLSGFLNNIETAINTSGNVHFPVVGIPQVLASLWVLGLIPVAKGVAHVINGVFFAPKPEELQEAPEPQWQEYQASSFNYQPQPSAMPSAVETPSVISTNELERDANSIPAAKQPISVVEDETKRFETQEAKPA